MGRTVILGAGFGGITVATELRRAVDPDYEIILIDRREHFLMGLRKLWAIVGMGTMVEGRRPIAALADRGIRVVRARVTAIDPARRSVTAGGETYEADHLVIALGADSRPDLIPGFAENAHNVYHSEAIPDLAQEIAELDGGRVAIVIAGAPYKCPPAPYECAMLLHEHLQDRGVRDRTTMNVSTLQHMLLPNGGREGSEWLASRLAERDITFQVGRAVREVQPGRLVFEDGTLDAELIIGVPPHRPPEVVATSGLTGDGDWVSVDRETMATRFDKVWAIGDVTEIRLANGLPLPKAGLFAERQGERVAAAIAAEVAGTPPPGPYGGTGHCYIEAGKEIATRIEGEFYAEPEPRLAILGPSEATAREKHEWEAERLAYWFGA